MALGGFKRPWSAGKEMSPEYRENEKQAYKENKERREAESADPVKLTEEVNILRESNEEKDKEIARLKAEVEKLWGSKEE